MPRYVWHALRFVSVLSVYVAVAGSTAVFAQLTPINPLRESDNGKAIPKTVVVASADFTRPDADGRSVLSVTAKIAKGWHIYSVTQAKGGPVATKIKFNESPDFKAAAEFKPTKPPEIHNYPEAWKDLKVEEHHESVTWKGAIEISNSIDPTKLEIKGAVYAQACAEQCLAPKSYPFIARLAHSETAGKHKASEQSGVVWPLAPDKADEIQLVANQQLIGEPDTAAIRSDPKKSSPGKATREYRNPGVEADISGRIEPAFVPPGGTAYLVLSVAPHSGWHFYAYADEPKSGQSKPTLIQLVASADVIAALPVASSAPKQKPSPLEAGAIEVYYDKPVEWRIALAVPGDAAFGPRTIEGLIGLQTCNENTCLTPHGVRFSGTLEVAEQARTSEPAPLAFTKATYSAVARAKADAIPPIPSPIGPVARAAPAEPSPQVVASPLPAFQPQNVSAPTSLPVILGLSLLGGLLLNLMPCVLPVIGLKILAFVEQGGRKRSHVLALNLWYSAGILSVFLILATMAAFLNVGWGEQFQSTTFNVVLAAIVFVMALSFLGVWEVPIPGFAGSSKASELAHREGFFGAFFKGVLTTVLATPCSAPLLGPVFGFTLRQPPAVIYLIFSAIGVGLASPYLLIGVFPKLIRLLPKPGAWMDTFKQLMGFVLLGTVVFLLTFIDRDYVVPTFALLSVLWAACWWINRTPLTADASRRLRAWGQAALFAGIVGYFSFTLLLPKPSVLTWEPFSIAAWNRHTAEGKTVLVDFTADWCLNCKLNTKVAIDTDAVRQTAEANGVVPLLADYSDESDEIKLMLEALGSRSIPLLAIFPAGQPTRPIVLRDIVTKSQVVEALRQAGPSKNDGGDSVAMRR